MYFVGEDPRKEKYRVEPPRNKGILAREDPVGRIEEQPRQGPDIFYQLPHGPLCGRDQSTSFIKVDH